MYCNLIMVSLPQPANRAQQCYLVGEGCPCAASAALLWTTLKQKCECQCLETHFRAESILRPQCWPRMVRALNL